MVEVGKRLTAVVVVDVALALVIVVPDVFDAVLLLCRADIGVGWRCDRVYACDVWRSVEESEQTDESRCRMIMLTLGNEVDGRIVVVIVTVNIGDVFEVTLDMVRG